VEVAVQDTFFSIQETLNVRNVQNALAEEEMSPWCNGENWQVPGEEERRKT